MHAYIIIVVMDSYIPTVLALVYSYPYINKFIHANEKWLVHSNHRYMCCTTHNFDHPNYID